ncbi:Ig-like domain-containing protein [Croceiramulus getboli]|nr:Ig-like domain-containing protein [Flavobacteriaceae bacterium YJPT1-3]
MGKTFTLNNSRPATILSLWMCLVVCALGSAPLLAQTTFTENAAAYGLNIGGDKDGGHAWADFDLDGDLDLLINRLNTNSVLLRRDGNTFVDVTNTLTDGMTKNRERSAIWADFNGDGYPDFFRNTSFDKTSPKNSIEIRLQHPATHVFGDGLGGTTPQIFGESNIADGNNTEGAGAFDFDGDGDLDIFFDNHDYGIDILINDGTGHFSHATAKGPGYDENNPATWPFGLAQDATDGDYGSATDYDNDGYVDIISRKRDQVDFFRNVNGYFTESVDIDQAQNGNKGAVAFYDFDNDGDFDLFWTENGQNQIHENRNGVWVPLGNATGIPTSFSNNTIEGLACGDVDNDGDIDIFVVGKKGLLFINQINSASGANTGSPMTFVQDTTNKFFNSGSTFGEGCTFIDIDNDGDLDLYGNKANGNNHLYINGLSNASSGNFVFLDILEDRAGAGMQNGRRRYAHGATVRLVDCEGNVISGLREVNGGNGHGTQDVPRVHFGIPNNTGADIIAEVFYPYLNGERVIVRKHITSSEIGQTSQVTVITPSLQENNAPTAEDDILTTEADTAISFNVFDDNGNGADSDPDGDTLFIASFTQPAAGTLVDNGNGVFTFTPDPGFVGIATFSYTIGDNGACSVLSKNASAQVTISVFDTTDPDCTNSTTSWTTANPSSSTTADNSVDVTLTMAASGAALIRTPKNGTFANNEDSATFWSNPAVQGANSYEVYFTWDSSPEAGGSDIDGPGDDQGSGTFTLVFSRPVVDPVIHIDRLGGNGASEPQWRFSNSAKLKLITPGAVLQRLAGTPNFNVEDNAFFRTPDEMISRNNDEASLNSSKGTAAGSVQVSGEYTELVFEWNGIGVEGAGSDCVEFIIDACAENNVPQAQDDEVTTTENTFITIDVTDNDDFGLDGPSTGTIALGDQPTNGTVVVSDDGTPNDPTDDMIIYTPNPDFNGTDTFTYLIEDADGDTSEATVTVTVRDVIVVPPGERTCDCGPFYENSNFTNPSLVSGTALQVGAVYRFSNIFPNNDFGTTIDALVEIKEFMNGASLLNIDVTNQGIDRAFQPRINSTNNGDQSVKFEITFVSGGGNFGDEVNISFFGSPFDIDGDSVSTVEYQELSLPDAYFQSANTLISIERKEMSIRGTAVNPTTAPGGTISDDPRYTFSNYWENKSSLTFTIGKQNGNNDRFYSLQLDNADYINPESNIITAPVICGNVSDEGGDPIANVKVNISGTDGTDVNVFTDINGDFRYTTNIPSALVDVTYTLTETDKEGYVSISDVDGANDNIITRVVNLQSSCGNDYVDDGRPEANPDAATTNEDIAVTVAVLDNDDFGPDGPSTGSIGIFTQPANGTVVVNTNGNDDPSDDTITYTPGPDFTGVDSFEYVITDSDGDTAVALVEITVTPVNDVMDDTATTPEDTPVVIDVLANDGFDPDTDVEVTSVTDPENGSVVINADGTVTYTPDPDFVGEDTFEYTVTVTNPDGTTSEETATVTVTVTPVNDVMDDTATTPEDTPVVIDVLANDGFDPDTDVEVTSVTDPENGSVVINADGTVTYTPDPDFVGEDTFEYTVTVTNPDGTTSEETATVTVTVTPVNDVMDDTATTPEDTPVVIDVLANDGFDPDTEVEVTSVTDPENGSVVINADGTVTYTPDPDFVGEDTFEYTVTVTNPDGTTSEETATVTVTVTPVDDVMDDTATTPEDTPVVIDVLANDGFDPDTDVEVTSVTDPENGSVVINADGTVTYTPDPDFVGEDTFEYTVTVTNPDGTTSEETATVTVTVTPVDDVMDDTATTPEDTPVVIDVLANDGFDPDTEVEVTSVTDPENGSVVINADGTVTYTPDPDFVGEDTFEYTVTVTNPDGTTSEETATVTVTVTPVDDVMDDTATTPEDTPVVIDVLANDGFDPDTEVEVTSVTDPENGSVVINADGTVTYTPDPDFVGEDTFEYTVTVTNPDGTTSEETATVTVTVTPVDDVMDDTATTPEDTPVVIDVLANDGFDPDTEVEVTSVTDPENGSVVINADGTVTYTPDPDFVGEDTFEYTVTVTNPDGTTSEETATVTVTVTPVNDVMDDTATTPEDTPVVIDVLANDGFDPDTEVEVTSVTDPENGSVVINADGTVTYTPDPDFVGEDTFEYTVTVTNPDGTTSEETATVTVTVTPVDDVMDDMATTPEDTPVVIDVLANDGFDPDTDVEVTSVTDPENGTVVINADGTVTYTPDPDFVGEDTFEYTVTVTNPDGTTSEETATVTVTVTPVDDVMDDTATTPEDTPVVIDVLANDGFDPDTEVEVTSVTDPENGSVVINADGTVTYTPDPDFVGEDTFEYTVTVTNPDGTTSEETATVTVTVTPVDDAVDDALTTEEDTTLTNVDLLANDTFGADTDAAVTGVTQPDSGNAEVVLNADGTVDIIPSPDFVGEVTFTYTVTVTNADGTTSEETATVTVTVTPVQDAFDDQDTTPEDTPITVSVLDNDTFANSDFEVTSTTDPSNGSVVINADGTITYTPNDDFNGTDTFTYTVTVTHADGTTNTETATVTIVVDGSGSPDAVDDVLTTEEDTTLTNVDLLANDTFGADTDAAVTGVTQPDSGNAEVVLNADGTVDIIPSPDFVGEVTFTYTVTVTNADGTTSEETATVTVTVTPVQDAFDDQDTTPEDTPITVSVLDNDTFANSDFEVTSTTDPTNGSVVINADGTITYTPNDDFNGTDTFTYTVTVTHPDGTTNTETATVTIVVDGSGSPDAVDDELTTEEDTTLTNVDLLANDTFGADTDAAVTGVTQPDSGNAEVVLNADGTVDIIPAPDFVGEVTFTYTVTVTNADGTTSEETATVTVTVTPVQDAFDDQDTTPEDTPITVSVLDNDTFANSDFEVTSTTDPTNGSVVINADGTITYTPNDDFNGTDTFTYTVTVTHPDGTTNTETATVTIVVDGSGSPDAVDDVLTTEEDTTLTNVDLLANDTFGADTDAAVTGVTQPDSGNAEVVLNADGTVDIIPAPDFVGEVTFTYTVTVTNADGTTSEETATVTVTVTPVQDAFDDEESTIVNTPITVNVLDNDTFANSDFEVTSTTDPTNGSVVINADGTITYTPDPDFVGVDTFEYTVTVTHPDGTTNTETATVTITVVGTGIQLVKTSVWNDENGDGFAQEGETITYTFTVTNTGDVTISGTVINDALIGITDLAVTPDPLAPGAVGTATATYTITQADIDAGSIVNSALATGQDPNGDDVEDISDDGDETTDGPDEGDDPTDDPTITDLPGEGTISLIKTSVWNDENGDGFAQEGETITYTFTVTNTGDVTISGTVINDALIGITDLAVTPDPLAPGAVGTATATYTITQADIDAGSIVNSALATGQDPNGDDVEDISDDGDETTDGPDEGDDPTDDPTITDLPGEGTISLIKTSVWNDENGDGFAQEGETITYTFTVTNTGDVTISGTVINDALIGITDLAVTPDPLAPGAVGTATATYTITQADIDAGSIVNSALATGQDPNGDDVEDISDDGDETTDGPDEGDDPTDDPTITDLPGEGTISLIKTSVWNDENGDGFAQEGETITYTFTVTNTGDVTISGTVINDALIGITDLAVTPDPLVPGAVGTATATYTITQADIDAGSIVNSALATGQDPNGDDVEDISDDGDETTDGPDEGDDPTDDPTITDLPGAGALSLIKTSVFNDENFDFFAEVGETITFTFTVTNVGGVTIENIVISDPLIGITDLAITPSTLAPGETGTATATYVITDADVQAEQFVNSALATGQDINGDDVTDVSDDGDETVDGPDEGDDPTDDPTITDLPAPSPAPPVLAIELDKIASFRDDNQDGLPQVGETIAYRFTVRNTSDVDLFDITIEDPLVTVSGGPIDLEADATDSTTFTAEYQITAEDIDRGFVENQATVFGFDMSGGEVEDLSDDPFDNENIDLEDDGEPDDPTVVIFQGVLPEDDDNIIIYDGISPNDDGLNDVLVIEGLENFPENTLQIFNRWGVEVFNADGYGQSGVPAFRGESDGRVTVRQGEQLPTGTYYYILNYERAPGNVVHRSGFLYINR